MTKIIKKNNKYYKQEIIETEITLGELQEELDSLQIEKQARFDEETKMFEDRIAETQSQINQLKLL